MKKSAGCLEYGGGVRFVYSQFDWVRNRIFRKRKLWLSKVSGCDDVAGFNRLYDNRWWFVIGEALMNVILPIEYYQVLGENGYQWDELGWSAYQEDLGRYQNFGTEDARRWQSIFDFHYAEGIVFGFGVERAKRYAVNRIRNRERGGEVDPQMLLDLEKAIERTRRTSST